MEENKNQCSCGGNCNCGNKMNNEKIKESGNEEEKEVEVFEFSLNEEEINELIVKLVELKLTKGKIDFEIDDDNDLLIRYDDEEEDDVGEKEGTRPSDAGLEKEGGE